MPYTAFSGSSQSGVLRIGEFFPHFWKSYPHIHVEEYHHILKTMKSPGRTLCKLPPALYLLLACSTGDRLAEEYHPAQALIDAENNFARAATEINTRQAFLANMSDHSVVYQEGHPVNAHTLWTAREPDSSRLAWQPSFVGISRSELIGFTTGPWQWYASRREATPNAYGNFVTVWEKTRDQGWKFVIDMGISCPEDEKNPGQVIIFNNTAIHECIDLDLAKRVFLSTDSLHNAALEKGNVTFLADAFTTDGRLLRNGTRPVKGDGVIRAFSEEQIGAIHYIQSGGAPSTSQDIGYAFGLAQISSSRRGDTSHRNAGYLRIWVNDNGTWKILIDVLN